MSLRQYTVRTEMNRLRKRACQIWQSTEVAAVIRKVELEIEKLRLVIRQDRNITKDVGMKQSLLKLILSYNPLWLRIGLETIYGELLPLRDNADLVSMSRFLITRWLSNPDILSEFAHPSVPHSYRDGCQDELNKFAMKKFLELVYFLDIAKETKLIRHNPCLFCPDSQYKSSRELLLVFAKDFLAGEGDLTKHMAYMGYVVCHKQTKLDEFDFAVTNIKTDLRCGVRLAKVAELLAGHSDIMSQLRVPSVSKLQKVHNVDISLATLRAGGAEIRKEIAGKDLVDGHREKTLELLWSIIFGYQLATILNLDNIREEIDHLRRSLNAKARLGDKNAKDGVNWVQSILNRSPEHSALAGERLRLQLLLEWVRLVLIHYGVEIDNWTTSWCDGRALCLLVHHYQPTLLHRQEIRDQTTITHHNDNQNLDDSADFSYGSKNLDSKTYEGLVENEKNNFKLLLQRVSLLGGVPVLISPSDMTNTIPDEKVTATFIGYLAVRLLDLSREIKAARVIQLAWRKFYAVKMEEKLKVFNKAATVLQRHVRIFLQRRRIVRFNSATLTLQKYTRGFLARKLVLRLKQEKHERRVSRSVSTLQSWWRCMLIRKQFLRKANAVVTIQSYARGWKVRNEIQRQHDAAAVIQTFWRRKLKENEEQRLEIIRGKAVVLIQATVRSFFERKRFLALRRNVILLQSIVRRQKEARKFQLLKKAAVTVQQRWRALVEGRKVRSDFEKQRLAVVKIQSMVRMWITRRNYSAKRQMIIQLQAVCKGHLCRKEMSSKLSAIDKIQSWWRSVLITRKVRQEFLLKRQKIIVVQSLAKRFLQQRQFNKLKQSAILIQKHVRGRIQREHYLEHKKAALVLQMHWRNYQHTQSERRQYLQMKSAAIKIASWWKMKIQSQLYAKQKSSAIVIQSNFRMWSQKKAYEGIKSSALVIQNHFRAHLAAKKERQLFLLQKSSVTIISGWWKMLVARRKFLCFKNSAIKVQALVKCLQQRKRFLMMKSAASVLQCQFRALQVMKVERERFREMKSSAILIQSHWRRFLARKSFSEQRNAAILIQSRWRGVKARKEYLQDKASIVIVQSLVRMRQARRCYLKQKSSAVVLQSWWRMQQSRMSYKAVRAIVIMLQAHVKKFIAMKKLKMMKKAVRTIEDAYINCKESQKESYKFLQLKKSAIVLQTHWRRRQAMVKFESDRLSIIKTQTTVRAFLARRKILKLKRENLEKRSATLIQSRFRGFRARGSFLRQKKAVLCLQTRWRSTQQMRKEKENYLSLRSASVTIQSVWRGYQARKDYSDTRRKVTLCQATVKGFLARRDTKYKLRCVKTIQTYIRRCQAAHKQRQHFLKLKSSAIVIQSAWRCWSQRRLYLKERSNISLCQASVRGFLARRDYHKKVKAIKIIQNHLRMYLLAKIERRNFLSLKQAATTLQSVWRGRIQRLQYREERSKVIVCQAAARRLICQRRVRRLRRERLESQCATTIQKVYKGYRQRQQFSKLKTATVLIQTRLRATLLRNEARALYIKQKSSAVKIQSAWRGWIVKKQYESEMTKVVLCQSVCKGFLLRKRFLALKNATTSIQKTFRRVKMMKAERRRYLQMKQSSIVIQSWWRMIQMRKAFDCQKDAALVLQRGVRVMQARMKLADLRHMRLRDTSATVIQSYIRGWRVRRDMSRMKAAARLIENWYGACRLGLSVRRDFLQQRQAAVKLQSWFRGNVARKNYLLQQQSAIKLQSWWKMVAQKKSYSSLVTATTLLQLQWRSRKQGGVVRKNFLMMKNSAVKIQAWWKGSQMRKEFLLKKCSAIIIQKHFRAMRARDFVKRKQAALVCLQRAAAMMKQRKHFLKTKTTIIGLQAQCRAFLARKHHLQLKYDHQYREQLRLEAERLEEQRRETAAVIISHQMRMVVVRKQFLKTRKSAVTIQKFWRGYWHRKVVMEKRNEMAATYKQMKEIKARLEDVTAAARPEDCLAARTDVAIDYIFSIRDVAQLVRAVKTLDVSTRLSLDCCVRMTHMYKSGSPLMQLVSLMARCNRSEPHKEVVSTTLDILINVARVDCTREGVAAIPNLLSDIFQAMLVYRDTSAVIFCKCCALLQILSASQIMQSQLTTSQSKKKLVDYHTIVSKKKKLKDENQKRKSINVLAPVSSARKPLRPHNVTSVVATPAKLNTTVTVSTEKKIRQSLDTTVTLKPTKLRKPSLDLATCPPWTFDSNPRHHDDPVTAVTSLNNVLGISI